MFHQVVTFFAIGVAICAIPISMPNPNYYGRCATSNFSQEEIDAYQKELRSGIHNNWEELLLSLKETSPSAYEKFLEQEAGFESELQKLGEEAKEFARKARFQLRVLLNIVISGNIPTANDIWEAQTLTTEYSALSDEAKAQLTDSCLEMLMEIEA